MSRAIVVPPARNATAAYRIVADRLRAEIAAGAYPSGVALPTEADLCLEHDVSRQTVRRAFQDLVAEGIVYRIPGRGTFVAGMSGKYVRSSGSIDELMALADDTDLDVLDPPTMGVDISAAGRLHLDSDTVVTMRFRRLHLDRPYCVTTAFLPVAVGRGLLDVPEFAVTGVQHNLTVLSVVERVAGRPIAGADQTITAELADARIADALECREGDPVLRIDRLYIDHNGDFLELAINHFNVTRYTYRFQMRANAP